MYLRWNNKTLDPISDKALFAAYADGYVCTRPTEGYMEQTRSVRISLADFSLSSENRRILRKTKDISLERTSLPLESYDWNIGKIGKEFYETKFGAGTFSANKIKELLTSGRKDFTTLLTYLDTSRTALGYAICAETPELLHYSFPFYDVANSTKNIGMGMMVRAAEYAKSSGKKYCYLGSAQRPGDTYKLQFDGMEWFDGSAWQTDLHALKDIL